jgi:two-component system sensor histidine kinase SenX3
VGDDPAAAERFAGRLVHEADRLGRLITDLLDLSRLEDPPSASRQRIPFSLLAQHEVKAASEEAEAKSIELSSSVEPDLWVYGDRQQLSLMLRNLLDNALRYTSSGGHVTLGLRGEAAEVVVRVEDTGIGIPREAQGRVFERFYRVDRARSRDRGGTGLGLAIVKHAVEQHGGTIALESELERGSTFTVRLPAAEPDRARIRSVAG